jgi:flavin-binding protein dodecin
VRTRLLARSRDAATRIPPATAGPEGKVLRMAVIKTIDLVGVSRDSWRDAAQQALDEASRTIREIQSMDILDTSCTVSEGRIKEYLTHVRIQFRIER